MRTRLRARLLAVVFSSGLLAGLGGAAHGETLAEAIAIAYESNPAILIARSQLKQADETYFRAARTFSPTLRADVTITGNTDNDLLPGNNTTGSSSAGVRVTASGSQPIYTGGRLSAQLRQQEFQLLSQRESLRLAEQTLVSNVVTAYVNVRRAEQTLAVAQSSVVNNSKFREEAQARFEVGQSTQTELQQALSRQAQAETQRIQAEAALQNARAAYASVVGQLPGTLAEEPSLDPVLPKSVDEASTTALQDNPTLRQRYLSERSSAFGITAARAAYKPTVSLTVNASAAENNSAAAGARFGGGLDAAGVTTGITVGIPLFAGLTTPSTVRSAVEANRSDNFSIEQQRRQVLQNVITQFNNLTSQRASVASNQVAVAAARISNEGSILEQQVGIRTQLDVLNAEQELRVQEQNLVNARFSAYTAAVELLNQMGRLDPRIFNPSIVPYDPLVHFEDVNDFELPWEPLVREIDQIFVEPPPERPAAPGEIVPTFKDIHGQ
jgi:outer membrane protein